MLMKHQKIYMTMFLRKEIFSANCILSYFGVALIDYSMDMLEQARKRLGSHAHIKCIQGDVGNLQMENESVDTVVSMNGFHAFLDKQKAFHEIWRVLKPGGDFIACFYIRGKSQRTDWLV